jgi:hypothetical protein
MVMVGAASDRCYLRVRCRCSANRSSKADKGVAKDDVEQASDGERMGVEGRYGSTLLWQRVL